MIRISLFTFFIILMNYGFAQDSVITSIKFDSLSHDFGEVKLNAKTEYVFWFTNTGKSPLILKNVTVSCGCTTPTWSKDPVKPGQRGSVTVRFECFPVEIHFNKTISVESNTDPSTTMLEIKGKCVDKYKTLQEKYPMASGRFLFVNNHAAFDKIYTNESNKQRFLSFYNNSDDTVLIYGFSTPAYIKCIAVPDKVKPRQEGSVYVIYDGTKNETLGQQFDRVTMNTNDPDAPRKVIVVSCEMMEYFDTTTSGNARIYLKEKSFEFGKVKPGEIKKHTFVIKNKGTDTLIIRKIRPSCGCTVARMENTKIPPGKSSKLEIEYNTLGATKGVNNKPVTIISTDRKNPSVNIGVSVVVE
jgi:hypothetical protein